MSMEKIMELTDKLEDDSLKRGLREAAKILRWPINTVKVTLRRCLEKLRPKLAFLKEERF